MRVIVVEAGDVGEVLTACFFEAFFDLFVDLFQRLNAIGGEGWGADSDVLFAHLGQSGDFLHGVRL